MNRTILTIILTFTFAFGKINAQTNWTFPSFEKLKSLTSISSNDDFKVEAKKMGYEFEEKTERADGTDFVYIRNTTIGKTVVTDRLIYCSYGNNQNPAIELTSTKDLEEFYLPFVKKEFSKVKCSFKLDSNELATCFENKIFYTRIRDKRITFRDATQGNSYNIRIYRR